METKQFPTPVLITVTTGRLCCEIGDLYEILIWTLDDPGIMTHQLPAASYAVMDSLYALFPWLRGIELPDGGGDDFTAAVQALCDEHGYTQDVPRTPDAQWVKGNALNDLIEIMGDKPILPVIVPDN